MRSVKDFEAFGGNLHYSLLFAEARMKFLVSTNIHEKLVGHEDNLVKGMIV
jgi:hypothetical protein